MPKNAKPQFVDDGPVLCVTRAQAAKMLTVSEQTIDDLIADRKLPATKIGRRVAILIDDVKAVMTGRAA